MSIVVSINKCSAIFHLKTSNWTMHTMPYENGLIFNGDGQQVSVYYIGTNDTSSNSSVYSSYVYKVK